MARKDYCLSGCGDSGKEALPWAKVASPSFMALHLVAEAMGGEEATVGSDSSSSVRANGLPGRVAHFFAREKAAYAHGEDRPVGSYAGLMGLYAVGVAGLSALVHKSGRPLPDHLSTRDLLLVSVASHKLSRLLAKDPVTSPLRVPFTRFDGTSGPAELEEETRGTGPQKAAGELLTCPFCIGQWVATGFVFGLLFSPQATRVAASVFTTLTAADFLQFAYAAVEQGVSGG